MHFIIKVCLLLFYSISLFGYLGQQKASFLDKERMRPMEMVVWYPTHAEEGTNEGTVWEIPDVAIDAPIKEGYIVVGIDHYGNTWKDHSEKIATEYWNRPVDISRTIDYLFEDSPFASSIDPERIGFAGFSMGGFTGIWLAGGEINQCSYQDPRIGAFFLMAPRAKEFSRSSLEAISSPLFIVTGESDEVLPYQEHSGYLSEYAPRKTFEILEGEVGHPVFINCPSELGKENLSPEITQDAPSVDREEVHTQVSQMAIQFFSESL